MSQICLKYLIGKLNSYYLPVPGKMAFSLSSSSVSVYSAMLEDLV